MRKFIYLFAIAAVMLGMASCGDGNNPDQPEQLTPGALKGKFTVAPGKQVRFSQGNLQYHQDKAAADNDYFAFAEHQYTIIGKEGNEGIDKVPCTIDLFGWGTGNSPRETSTDDADYAEFHEWGNNRIRNGGNEANLWRTLTQDEWVYLFHERTNAEKLFGLGSVNGVNGTILLPDNWTLPAGVTFTPSTEKGLEWKGDHYNDENIEIATFSHNTYSATEWDDVMERAGAVFLPAAGFRYNTDAIGCSSLGYYWSDTPYDENYAYYLVFDVDKLQPQEFSFRYRGQSVRLVQDIN